MLEGGSAAETRSLAIPDLQSSVMTAQLHHSQHLNASHEMVKWSVFICAFISIFFFMDIFIYFKSILDLTFLYQVQLFYSILESIHLCFFNVFTSFYFPFQGDDNSERRIPLLQYSNY